MDTIRRPVRRSMPARSDAYLSEFTINPALPEGVNMDPATGTITGSFRNTTSNQVYTVTGRNEYWYNFPGTTSVLPTSFFLLLHQLYTHPTSTPHLCRKLVIATHLLRSRYIQRCGMNRYIQYLVSVHTFSYHTVVPTSAYYLMVSTLCMKPQLLPISHGATLTYLPYCRVTKSFILLLPPIQSLRSE